MSTKEKKIAREHRDMLAFVRLLASYECAGPPACEPASMDVVTGKREGGQCGTCEAREWLIEHGYERRTP